MLVSFLLALCAALATGGTIAAGGQHAPTPVEAVRAVLRPYYVPGYNFANCTTRSPRRYPSLTCPETVRLRHRLRFRRAPMSGLPFCRCQSGPRTVRLRLIANNGHVARVSAWWDFGKDSFTDVFVIVRQSGGWLVDDEYCAGRPGTSIYTASGDVPCR